MLDRFLAGSLLFALVACGRPVPRTASQAPPAVAVPIEATTAPAAPPEGPGLAAIAIGTDESVDLTADGTMLDVVKGTRIAIQQRVFTLEKDVEEDTYVCPVYPGFDPASAYQGRYHAEGISLVDPRGKATVLIEKTEKQEVDGEMGTDEQGSSLVGVVGTYLFLREHHLVYGCGAAHSFHGLTAFVWDTASQQRVELTPPASAVANAKKQLEGRGFADYEPKLAEVIPQFDAEGRLTLRWRFEMATSYVESEGEGSDYTISVVAGSDDLPPELAAYREPPAAIRNYLANGGEPIRGWTVL